MLLLTCSRSALVGFWLYQFPRSTYETHGLSDYTSNVTVELHHTSHTLPLATVSPAEARAFGDSVICR
jgi:hypothetical protein